MGVEPTPGLFSLTLDLKSRRATGSLCASALNNIYQKGDDFKRRIA